MFTHCIHMVLTTACGATGYSRVWVQPTGDVSLINMIGGLARKLECIIVYLIFSFFIFMLIEACASYTWMMLDNIWLCTCVHQRPEGFPLFRKKIARARLWFCSSCCEWQWNSTIFDSGHHADFASLYWGRKISFIKIIST